MAAIAVAAVGSYAVSQAGSLGVALLIAAATTAVAVGAQYLDERYIYPALFGKDEPRNPIAPLGIDQMTGDDGAPSTNAWGRMALVGAHVLYFENFVVDSNRPTTKKGPGQTQTRRLADVGLAWCHGRISSVERVFADQKPFWERDANQAIWADYRVQCNDSAGTYIGLSSLAREVPLFSSIFEVGNIVYGRGWLASLGGGPVNEGYFRITSITAGVVGVPGEQMVLQKLSGQTISACIAGSAVAPLTLTRIDFGAIDFHIFYTAVAAANRMFVSMSFDGPNAASDTKYSIDPQPWWKPGRVLQFSGHSPAAANGDWFIVQAGFGPGGVGREFLIERADGHAAVLPTGMTTTNIGSITFNEPFGFREDSPGQSIQTFQGNETDGPDPTLAAIHGSANAHGYRGIARSTISRYNLSNFGDRVASHAGVVRISTAHSTHDPIVDLIAEAFGGDRTHVDLRDLQPEVLHGFARRGAQPTSSSLQPLAIAKGIESQEIGGQFRFFKAETAHQIQLREEDFGCYVGRRNRVAPFVYRGTPERLMPQKLSLMYRSPLADYARKEAIARSAAPGEATADHTVLDVDPMVMYPWEADERVRRLFLESIAARDQGKIPLPPSRCYLLPNDRVTFTALQRARELVDVVGGVVNHVTGITPLEEGSVTMEVMLQTRGNVRLVDVGGGEFEGLPSGLTVSANAIDYATGAIDFEPTNDVVLWAEVSFDFANFWRMRIQNARARANHLTECDLVGVVEHFDQLGSPTQFNQPAFQPTIHVEPINFEVLDVPAIGAHTMGEARGLLWAACPYPEGTWRGAVAYTSQDGATWTPRGVIAEPTPIGYLSADMGVTTKSSGTWDYSVEIVVGMAYGTPTTATLAELQQHKNWIALGDEIVAFREATANGDGTYTLRGLLRGMRNTEEKIAGHVAGTRVVFLQGFGEPMGGVQAHGLWDDWNLTGQGGGQALLQNAMQYKVVPIGGNVVQFPSVTKTITGRHRRPFGPTHLVQGETYEIGVDAITPSEPGPNYLPSRWLTADVVVRWSRRSRSTWDFFFPFPLWEPYERYRITVKKNGTIVKRVHIGDPTSQVPFVESVFRFTLAEQTGAGFASGNTAVIEVEQQGLFEYSPAASISWTIP